MFLKLPQLSVKLLLVIRHHGVLKQITTGDQIRLIHIYGTFYMQHTKQLKCVKALWEEEASELKFLIQVFLKLSSRWSTL